MYTLEITKGKEQNIKLILKGDLNLLNLKKIEKEIKEVPINYARYEICIEKVTDIDIPFLQLAYSFINSLKKEGKKTSIKLDLEGENKLLVEKSGFFNTNELNRN